MPTTNTIDRETSEAKLVEAERRDELLDSELDTVTGGVDEFSVTKRMDKASVSFWGIGGDPGPTGTTATARGTGGQIGP